jgi:hypothetical protein
MFASADLGISLTKRHNGLKKLDRDKHSSLFRLDVATVEDGFPSPTSDCQPPVPAADEAGGRDASQRGHQRITQKSIVINFFFFTNLAAR